MKKKKYNHIAIIHRSGLNNMLKRGYVNVPSANIVQDSSDDMISKLLSSIPPFDYTSEYVFLCVPFAKKKLNRVEEIEYKDVISIIPLDQCAKRELDITLNKVLELSEPKWQPMVEDFMQLLLCDDMSRGISACLELFGIKSKEDSFSNLLSQEDLKEKLCNYRFDKEQLNEQSSIWEYLLMYERHEPYPSNMLGYFYDALHVFVNFITKKEWDRMQDSKALLTLSKMEEAVNPRFEEIIEEMEKSEYSRVYIAKNSSRGIRRYIVIPLFFVLKDFLLSEDAKACISSSPYILRFANIRKKYEKEYELAVYLTGLQLGYTSIYELYSRKLKEDKMRFKEVDLFIQ